MSNVLHSKATPRWGSPEHIAEICRNLMGGIDLDPASESIFNEVIKALQYYSLTERNEDGLLLPWFGRVFCNPPGGLIVEFWEKMLGENIQQACWVGFSVEQFCLLADASAHPLDFSCCVLRKRLGFKRHDGFKGSPSHGNYVCAIGVDHARFEESFAPLGKVTRGRFSIGQPTT